MKRLSVAALLLALVATTEAITATSTAEKSLLMVGNSFTYYNKLDHMVGHLLEDGAADASAPIAVTISTEPTKETFYTQRIASGGAQLHQHVDNPEVQTTLAERDWTWVVLQEQSQIPGFYDTGVHAVYDLSIDSAVTLNHWIAGDDDTVDDTKGDGEDSHTTDTILLMTWGMKTTDPMNPVLYRDFHVMQNRLTHGYEEMQKALSTDSRPVRVAPAGLAFAAVYESTKSPPPAAASLPDATNTTQHVGTNSTTTSVPVAFEDLYASDGKHPSVHGSYLAACTIYTTLTGKDPRGLSYKPDEVSEEQQVFLQAMAAKTALLYNEDNVYNRAYFDHLKEEQAAEQDDKDKSSDSNINVEGESSSTTAAAKDHKPNSRLISRLKRSLAACTWVLIMVLLARVLVVRHLPRFSPASLGATVQRVDKPTKYEELSVTEREEFDDDLDISARSDDNNLGHTCFVIDDDDDDEEEGLHNISLEATK